MNNNQVLKSLVFFEENGRTYFGMRHGGQFIEYVLSKGTNSAAYGYGQTTLSVKGQVFQDNYDDITVDQKKLIAKCIEGCLERVGDLSFYSEVYRRSIKFERDDDIFDIMRKLNKMTTNLGGGKIY